MIPKFRAWDKYFKEMVQVNALVLDEQVIKVTYKNGNIAKEDVTEYELMQSTGLEDKNNKEIFEGDIIRMRNPRDRRQIGMFQVVRVANSPMLGLLDKKLTTEIFNLYEHMRNYYEIIGNIHENPELLEVTK